MDRNAEGRYNEDKQGFFDKIEEEIHNSIGGIYRLDPDTGLLPVSTAVQTNPIITNGSYLWYLLSTCEGQSSKVASASGKLK